MADGLDQSLGSLAPGVLLDLSQGIRARGLGGKEQLVDLFDFASFLGSKAPASESDDIESGELIDLVDDAIGRNIAGHAGVSLDHREVADVDELVNGGPASKERAVPDFGVSGHHYVVGDDVVVADFAIVTEVGDCHQEVVVTDAGAFAFARAPADGDIFSESVPFANDHAGIGRGHESQILRISSDDSSMSHLVVRAENDAPTNFGVRVNLATRSKFRVVFDDGVSANFDIVGDLG